MWKRAATAVLVAVTALALAASAASANALSVSDRDIYVIWDEMSDRLTLGGELETECNLTLLGAFSERTFTKTQGEVIGTIDHAEKGACEPAPGIQLEETLPWNITYQAFTGRLPSITSIRLAIVGAAFLVEFGGFAECLYTTTEENPIAGEAIIGAGGAVTGLAYDGDETIPTRDLAPFSFLCDGQEINGNGVADVENGASADIDFSLIGEGGPPSPGALTPSPERVVVEPSETSDGFTIRNTGGSTVTIESVSLEGIDRERPEFEATSPGCGSRLAVGASCTYGITVHERPVDGARVRFEWDDGVNVEDRLTSVEVEIDPRADPGLRATPSSVTVEEFEQNDTFVVRNEGDSTATISRVVVETADVENPDFDVSSAGCASTMRPVEACSYTIAVNARPEDDGRVTIHYRDEGGERTVSIAVDIAALRPAELEADPASVVIERLETNDSFVIRNIGTGTAAATILDIDVVAADSERPEFSIVDPGCGPIILDETSCTYIIRVNNRPEPTGRVIFEYEDGIGITRRTTIDVDIAS
jgi:hypothetical protein